MDASVYLTELCPDYPEGAQGHGARCDLGKPNLALWGLGDSGTKPSETVAHGNVTAAH